MVYVENPENSTVNFQKFRYLFDIFDIIPELFDIFDIIPEFSTNVENFDYFGSFGKAFAKVEIKIKTT